MSKKASNSLATYTKARRITATGDLPSIVALLDSPEEDVRSHAMYVIRRRRLTGAAPALTRRLPLEDDEMRATAMNVLARLSLPESRATFIEGLSDPSNDVCRQALQGLAAIGDPRVVPAGEEHYQSGERGMRWGALEALRRARTKDALEALHRLLGAERSWRWHRFIKKAIRRFGR